MSTSRRKGGCRKPGHGKTYIRKSMRGQGVGPEGALDWAINEAPKLRVSMNADHAALQEFVLQGSGTCDDLYYEGGISGNSSDRPVLQQFLKDVLSDETVSHAFVHMPDRLLRPEDPLEGMLLERQLLDAGVTLVFQDRIVEPHQRGRHDVGQDINSYLKYHQSGEELDKLADRMVRAKITLAKGGYWSGGRPPYGFCRVLVDANNTVLQELEEGMTPRRRGGHVRIMPKDTERIRVWMMILKLYVEEWGGIQAIANELNRLGIPSPGAGRTRRYSDGVKRLVPGLWTYGAVAGLIDNPAIIGVVRYGVQSEGIRRRIGVEGPRYLEDQDYRDDGKAKVVRNPEELVISAPAGFDPEAPIELFEAAQKRRRRTGKNQRGIPRSSDPLRYLLGGRVYNLTEEGWMLMYGRARSGRKEYVCGLYQKTGGAAGNHNWVDAEALDSFVLASLSRQLDDPVFKAKLRKKLRTLAMSPVPDESATLKLNHLKAAVEQLEGDRETAKQNLCRAKNDEEYDIVSEGLAQLNTEFETKHTELERLRETVRPSEDGEQLVKDAMALFDNIQELRARSDARSLKGLFQILDVRFWLYYEESTWGKRKVRKLAEGVMTVGTSEPPNRPKHGTRGVPSAA